MSIQVWIQVYHEKTHETHQSTSIQDQVVKIKNSIKIESRTIEVIPPYNTETSEQSHQNKTETKMNKKVSKRIKCEKCDKKARYNDHMVKIQNQNPDKIGNSSDYTKENPPIFFKRQKWPSEVKEMYFLKINWKS